MDLKTLIGLIGSEVPWRVQKVLVSVIIQDARTAYGRLEAQIEPCRGEGRQWVEISSLKLPE